MKSTIAIGNISVIEFEVLEEMSPKFHNKQIHPVCSTWDLAHQFEIAARYALEPHLEKNEEGIGTTLNIEHIKPAPIGKIVQVSATISSLNESTVECRIEATINKNVIARGLQVQRVFPSDKIDKLIQLAHD